ncbi:peroxisome biogenesis factor 2 [Patella vulgata]|uniref:peroxisome biogenesis factor 2 n=1 Tax=Patella vulgata TaxID=6465 RepID=UPI0024A82011|nr:peroxisome biogenesis factor 2 [Patella vulgata]
MVDNSEPVKALRVGQLDADELDNEVLNLTKSQLNHVFKYLQTGVFARYNPEINALLKLVLWKFTVFASGATIGQQILNIQYRDKTSLSWIGQRQKIMYALLVIGCPLLKERSGEITTGLGLTRWKNVINKCLSWIESTIKLATVLNFLVFLNRGGYLSLIERIMGIQSMYPQRQSIRQVSFEYMTRELLWHGFSEFLFFILPLINLQKIKNTIKRLSLRKTVPSKQNMTRSNQNLTSCVVCTDWPIHPHEIGCQHVFCYFCIQSNYKADPGFTCPLCNYPITSKDCIKPSEIQIMPGR